MAVNEQSGDYSDQAELDLKVLFVKRKEEVNRNKTTKSIKDYEQVSVTTPLLPFFQKHKILLNMLPNRLPLLLLLFCWEKKMGL